MSGNSSDQEFNAEHFASPELRAKFHEKSWYLDETADFLIEAGYSRVSDLGNTEDEVRKTVLRHDADIKKEHLKDIIQLCVDMGTIRTFPGVDGDLTSTPLGKAFHEKTAALDPYIEALVKAGFSELRYLGKSEQGVGETVRKYNSDIPEGLIAQIVELWSEATAEKEKRDPVAAPDLPKGSKVDLTSDEFKLGTNEPVFKIPKLIDIPKKAGEVRNAASLTDLEWLTVAANNRLCYGVNLENAYDAPGGFDSQNAPLIWVVPANKDFIVPDDQSSIEASMSLTEKLENFNSARIVSVAASFSSLFVGASAEARRDEKSAQTRESKTLRMSGMWNFPRVRVRLEHCTEVSPALVSALEDAVSAADYDEAFYAVQDILEHFGHAVPEEVVLGGQMYFSTTREANGSVDSSQVKNTVKAAVEFKAGNLGGDASVSYEDGNGTRVEAREIQENTSWRATGGDTTLVSNATEWANSVKNPNNWRVIERRGLRSVIDLLEPDLRERVQAVWQEGLSRMWSGYEPPRDYIYPPLKGMPFTIAHNPATTAPVLQAVRQTNYISRDEPIETCHTAPRVINNGASNPLKQQCLWKLIYTGRTTLSKTDLNDGDKVEVPVFFVSSFHPETFRTVVGVFGKENMPLEKKPNGEHSDGLLVSRLVGKKWFLVCEDIQIVANNKWLRDGHTGQHKTPRPGDPDAGQDGVERFWEVVTPYTGGLSLKQFGGGPLVRFGANGINWTNDPSSPFGKLYPWRVIAADGGWVAQPAIG